MTYYADDQHPDDFSRWFINWDNYYAKNHADMVAIMGGMGGNGRWWDSMFHAKDDQGRAKDRGWWKNPRFSLTWQDVLNVCEGVLDADV